MKNYRSLFSRKNLNLLRIQAESYNSSAMEHYIIKRLTELGHGNELLTDSYGNIYLTRGEAVNYPLLTAHMDTVHSIEDDYQINYTKTGSIFASTSDGKPQGIGGDDKCGLITILEILEKTDHPIKIALFKDEEIGCVGSTNMGVYKSFMDNVSYIIGIDRQGNEDVLTGWNDGNTSIEFLHALPHDPILKIASRDTITDSSNVGDLYSISNVNIASGYYKPHTKNEYIVLEDLYNTIEYVKLCLSTITTDTIYTLPEKTYESRYGGGYGGNYYGYGVKSDWGKSKSKSKSANQEDIKDGIEDIKDEWRTETDPWNIERSDEYQDDLPETLSDVMRLFDNEYYCNSYSILSVGTPYTRFIEVFTMSYGETMLEEMKSFLEMYGVEEFKESYISEVEQYITDIVPFD